MKRAFLQLGLPALFLAGCEKPDPVPDVAPEPVVAPAETRFPISVGGKTLMTRIRLTQSELTSGLMGSTSLATGEAMLFVYKDSAPRAFWMKNVPYDIDIGFFEETGRLDEILRLRANDTTPRRTASSGIRYALEAPCGWFESEKIRPGALLRREEVSEAVRARGFRVKEFVPSAEVAAGKE